MFKGIMLVFVVMSGDGSAYKDFVAVFPDMAKCEQTKADLLASVRRSFPPDSVFSATCIKPRALGATDV